MTARCTGTPVSWLALERLAAGDLPDGEAARVREHLAACEACASCARDVEGDRRVLPPLPGRRARVRPLRRYGAATAGGLAMAAAIALFVGRGTRIEEGDRVKGGDVAFVLVGDDETAITEAGGAFVEGRSYKVLVTCPPGMVASWDVAVFEGASETAAFPLPPARALACGNGVPMPGAFRVTGREALQVCLVFREGGGLVARDRVRRGEPGARCKTLTPGPQGAP